MPSILLFSVAKNQFVVETSRGSGPGGQNKNRRDTKVVIRHPSSGAVGMAQDERTQEQNKKIAFRRCVESKKFQSWLRLEIAKRAQGEESTTRWLEKNMKESNLQVENILSYSCDAQGCKSSKQVIHLEGDKSSLPEGWIQVDKDTHACSEKCARKIRGTF